MIFRPSDGHFGYSNNNTVLGTLMAGASALVKRENKRKSREKEKNKTKMQLVQDREQMLLKKRLILPYPRT